MNGFLKSVSQVFEGAAKAFKTFPAAMISAVLFAIVAMVRIQMDWPEQEAYNFLFNCLHFALALGSIFGLASTLFFKTKFPEKKAPIFSLISTFAVAIVTFFLLYYLGGVDPLEEGYRIARLTDLSTARVMAAIFISFVSFIIIFGKENNKLNFSSSFFVTHKAFFIAMLYGLVILAGASGVAGSIQALLYNNMSEKVYMYISTLSGFIAFAIFAGYFPDFKNENDERLEIVKKQPKFIEALLEYILVPIFLALTVVLVLWAMRTLFFSTDIEFTRLYSISSSYVLWGLWLWILLGNNSSKIADFYKKFYPFAAIFILAFKGWALIIQLNSSSLKDVEYGFILILILSGFSSIFLILKGIESLNKIAVLSCILAGISVLPIIGYHSLPVRFQVNRLENLLLMENILKDNILVPAITEPERDVRENITDAVNYLAYSQSKNLPVWFDKSLREGNVFKEKLGFEQTYPESQWNRGRYMGLNLFLPDGAIDIRDYDFVINIQGRWENSPISFKGNNGNYEVSWSTNAGGIPILKIDLNGETILSEDMNSYIDRITDKYPLGEFSSPKATIEDMTEKFETPEIEVLIIFNSVDIGIYGNNEDINYWLNLNSIYIKEKNDVN